jgi:hypothetical protein
MKCIMAPICNYLHIKCIKAYQAKLRCYWQRQTHSTATIQSLEDLQMHCKCRVCNTIDQLQKRESYHRKLSPRLSCIATSHKATPSVGPSRWKNGAVIFCNSRHQHTNCLQLITHLPACVITSQSITAAGHIALHILLLGEVLASLWVAVLLVCELFGSLVCTLCTLSVYLLQGRAVH